MNPIIAFTLGAILSGLVCSVLSASNYRTLMEAYVTLAEAHEKWRRAYHDLAAKRQDDGEEWKQE